MIDLTSAMLLATTLGGLPADWTIEEQALGTEPVERLRFSLPIRTTCMDRRFPRLAGPFVAYCSTRGRVDRVLDLHTGAVLELDPVPTAPWTGPSVLISLEEGIWTLPDTQPSDTTPTNLETVGPAVSSGGSVLLPTREALQVRQIGANAWYRYPAEPAPWVAPALSDQLAIWTRLGPEGSDLFGTTLPDGDTVPVATGPGHQHHPITADTRIAWIDSGDVVLVDTATDRGRRFPATAGATGGLAFTGAHVCWAERRQPRVVRCSDGFSAPGTRPSGHGHLLLVHEGEHAVLYAATQMPLRTPTDAEEWVEGEARIEWLGPDGWTAEALDGNNVRAQPVSPLPRALGTSP